MDLVDRAGRARAARRSRSPTTPTPTGSARRSRSPTARGGGSAATRSAGCSPTTSSRHTDGRRPARRHDARVVVAARRRWPPTTACTSPRRSPASSGSARAVLDRPHLRLRVRLRAGARLPRRRRGRSTRTASRRRCCWPRSPPSPPPRARRCRAASTTSPPATAATSIADRSLRMDPADGRRRVRRAAGRPAGRRSRGVRGRRRARRSPRPTCCASTLEGGIRVQVRPSGTEPKVKLYGEAVDTDPDPVPRRPRRAPAATGVIELSVRTGPIGPVPEDRTSYAGGPNWRSPASPRPGTMKAVLVEVVVDGGGDDVDGEAGLAQALDALRGAQRADDGDRRRGVALEQQLDGVDERAAGRQHRVDDDHRPAGQRLGQLVDVRLRRERLLVAADPDEPDVGVGQQLLGGVDEAEPGAQDRHDDRLHGEPLHRRGRQRRLDRAVDRRQRLGGPGHQQRADALEVLAEQGVRRRAVADAGQRVDDERVLDDGDGDGVAVTVLRRCGQAPNAVSARSRA